jgi:hypothetical protein
MRRGIAEQRREFLRGVWDGGCRRINNGDSSKRDNNEGKNGKSSANHDKMFDL